MRKNWRNPELKYEDITKSKVTTPIATKQATRLSPGQRRQVVLDCLESVSTIGLVLLVKEDI